MTKVGMETIHHHLLQEIRRRARQAGQERAMLHDKASLYWKAAAAAESLDECANLVALHAVLGSDFGTILHTAVASYVRDRDSS